MFSAYNDYMKNRPTGCASPAVLGAGQVVSVRPKHKLAPSKTAFVPLRASLKDTPLVNP